MCQRSKTCCITGQKPEIMRGLNCPVLQRLSLNQEQWYIPGTPPPWEAGAGKAYTRAQIGHYTEQNPKLKTQHVAQSFTFLARRKAAKVHGTPRIYVNEKQTLSQVRTQDLQGHACIQGPQSPVNSQPTLLPSLTLRLVSWPFLPPWAQACPVTPCSKT